MAWNPMAEQMFGFKREEILGKRIPGMNDEQKEGLVFLLQQAFHGQRMENQILSFPRKGGGEISGLRQRGAAAESGGNAVCGAVFFYGCQPAEALGGRAAQHPESEPHRRKNGQAWCLEYSHPAGTPDGVPGLVTQAGGCPETVSLSGAGPGSVLPRRPAEGGGGVCGMSGRRKILRYHRAYPQFIRTGDDSSFHWRAGQGRIRERDGNPGGHAGHYQDRRDRGQSQPSERGAGRSGQHGGDHQCAWTY